jgi:hypothetical protein
VKSTVGWLLVADLLYCWLVADKPSEQGMPHGTATEEEMKNGNQDVYINDSTVLKLSRKWYKRILCMQCNVGTMKDFLGDSILRIVVENSQGTRDSVLG